MVIPALFIPILWQSPPRSQNFLSDEDPDLHPYPSSQDTESLPVGLRKQDVIFFQIEVSEWQEAENRLSDDEFPQQSFAAVADDVSSDLREPDREVEHGEGVDIEGADGDGP